MQSALTRVVGLSILWAAPVMGQDNRFEFLVSNTVTPEQPAATVEAWFRFNPDFYAFAGAFFDVSASADPGGWSNPEAILTGPSTRAGDVSGDGDSVTGIFSGQLHFPPGGFFADTSNPILVWRATWSTSDFSPREVRVLSATEQYGLYPPDGQDDLPYGTFSEGAASIFISGQACYPDFTGDGSLDLFDFLAYVNAFNAGDAAADCDLNGSFDLFDFLCFVNAFNAGC